MPLASGAALAAIKLYRSTNAGLGVLGRVGAAANALIYSADRRCALLRTVCAGSAFREAGRSKRQGDERNRGSDSGIHSALTPLTTRVVVNHVKLYDIALDFFPSRCNNKNTGELSMDINIATRFLTRRT